MEDSGDTVPYHMEAMMMHYRANVYYLVLAEPNSGATAK
jgi:hypothetical protein